MIISEKGKLIFIHIHRTGGTSLGNWLRGKFPDARQIGVQHTSVRDLTKDTLALYAGYFRFTVVRNPWDRILSWYLLVHGQSAGKKGFESFLKYLNTERGNSHFHFNQLDYITDGEGNLWVDHLADFESYQEDLNEILRSYRLTFSGEVLNNGPGFDRRDYYTDKTRALIASYCARDIDYFGFSFDAPRLKNTTPFLKSSG